VCKDCFSKIIEKRIRKRIRLNKLFRKGDRILVSDKLSFYLVKKIIKDLPVKLFLEKSKKIKVNKLVVKWTLDDKLLDFLESLFFGKKTRKPKQISILDVISDDEAVMFSKINNIKFKPNKKDKNIVGLLNSLEKKYPEMRFSLSKSVSELTK
jgi:tRNA(Ile)-lysidine synthase TilS/MesJ